jgi:hypothetical protein
MRTNTKEDLFKKENTETIVLSDLEKSEALIKGVSDNFEDYDEDYDFEYRFNDNNIEKNNELIVELDKLKPKTFELYYKIDEQKAKELESVFKQTKLKINLNQKPKMLKDGVLWTSKESFTMYDSKFFKKIFEIKLENGCDITSAIELDNKDLVLLAFVKDKDSWNRACKILIYRLKNDKYELIQTINENQKGYSSQFVQYGMCSRSISKKPYEVEYIKKISGNRFICVNSYGFKIYASNEKQEYSLISLNEYLEGIKIIYEINPNKFIFGTEKKSNNHYIRYYNNILFQVVSLKEITKEEINTKLNELDENDREYFGFFYFSKPNKENGISEESKKILESLKVSCSFKTLFQYRSGEYSYIKDFTILKDKYMIILLDSTLFVLSLDSEEILKKFDIKISINDKYYNGLNIDMKKWNNGEDNNFILFIQGNIYLCELYEDGKEIRLKILNHSYFPDFANKRNVEKLTEKENRFFIPDIKANSISLY